MKLSTMLGIVVATILWVALSGGIVAAMSFVQLHEWWQAAIPLCILWLAYVIVIRRLES
jgi:hypothetical protein